jgi:hypothetical protein
MHSWREKRGARGEPNPRLKDSLPSRCTLPPILSSKRWGTAVQCVNLTDDELWRAVAANTHAMSELLDRRPEVDAAMSGLSDPAKRTELMQSYLAAVNGIEGEYRSYTTELRRRHAA